MDRPILSPPSPTSPTGLRERKARRPAFDALKGVRPSYDVIVIGSGLAALTAANRLARCGWSVLLLEAHSNFGGLATWFKRRGGHVFDISLHGFPVGMKKTCRKYWTKEIADSIVQLRSIRFDNPQFNLETTYTREDFTRVLCQDFGLSPEAVARFFDTLRGMSFYDDQTLTTGELFEQFFPGRSDVHRLLMEPIAYANGSTLDDPAITYGIVFSNFMSEGVFTFHGGTSQLIKAMKDELVRNGVDLRNHAFVERVIVEGGRSAGVIACGRRISARAVVSNAHLLNTVCRLVGEEHWPEEFLEAARKVRINSSSCQVYLGLAKGESIPYSGELLFTSTHPVFESTALCALESTSRTFSFYYPELRPGSDMYSVVCSTNANYRDWGEMGEARYLVEKEKLARDTIQVLEKYVPGVGAKIAHVEVSTPRTFEFFTHHAGGSSFGTKFEGLKVSRDIPNRIPGLFHAGSVGIIMSGWLGAANYGVIVSNDVDRYLHGATG
jgi:phytoene dehydrogenase-like protein